MILYAAILLSLAALTLFVLRPMAGVALLFIGKPIIDTTFAQPLFYNFRLTEIVGALVPLAVLGHILFAPPERALHKMPLNRIWTIYMIDVFFFSLLIVYNQDFLSGVNVFFRYINGFVGFYMVQAFFHRDHEGRLKILLMAMIVAGLFPMGLGVYQAMTGTVWIDAQAEGVTRYVGLYHDAFTVRYYAFQTIFALMLYGALYAGENLFTKAGVLAYGLVSTAVMIGAYSKSGITALVLWIVSWTVLQRKMMTFLLILFCGGIFWVYYAPHVAANVTQLFHKEIGAIEGNVNVELTFAGRWFSWEEMISRWERFDWFRKGFGSGEAALGAHNDYLQMLFHGGLLGLSIYLSLLSAIGWKIVSNLREKADPISVAALMLFMMWLVDTIGLVPSVYPGYQWFVWGFIGLCLRMREMESEEEERDLTYEEHRFGEEGPMEEAGAWGGKA